MQVSEKYLRFTGYHAYADKKTWLPKIILNTTNENGFWTPLFFDSTNELVEELNSLTFWDTIVLTENISLK